MARNPNIYIPLWERAFESEVGIAIETNDPKLLSSELYKAREVANNPNFAEVMIFLPNIPDTLFMCRKTAELPE